MGEDRLNKQITVALVNDYELVLRGLVAMLAPFRTQIRVLELDLNTEPTSRVDIALFDSYGHEQLGLDRVEALAQCPHVDAVAVYTSYASPDDCADALQAGACGVLSKSMPADELTNALLAIAAGDRVVSEEFGDCRNSGWPGQEFGLTSRESEVAALLARGMSNKEIARALWISENTVKTHLKAIFQKTTTTSRAQAIVRITGDSGFVRRRTA
jgi:DNA-binding NarL/FixJ family response regulator